MADEMTAQPVPENPVATIFRLLEAREAERAREAELARMAEFARVQEGVSRNNGEWRRLRAEAGEAVAAVATPQERLLLARLNTKGHRALARGQAALRAGRDTEAHKHFNEYDGAQADAHWIWGVMIDRAYNGTDNSSLTDNFLLPGELQTVVLGVDGQGKPMRLSKYG